MVVVHPWFNGNDHGPVPMHLRPWWVAVGLMPSRHQIQIQSVSASKKGKGLSYVLGNNGMPRYDAYFIVITMMNQLLVLTFVLNNFFLVLEWAGNCVPIGNWNFLTDRMDIRFGEFKLGGYFHRYFYWELGELLLLWLRRYLWFVFLLFSHAFREFSVRFPFFPFE